VNEENQSAEPEESQSEDVRVELDPSEDLQEAVEKIGIEIEEPTLLRMQEYCHRLWEKNQILNLTRHTDYDTFAARDVMDTWQLSKLISDGSEILDIGSGGGVPGLLLSIMRPDLKVNLVDSVGKKIAAIEDFSESMQLDVQIFHCRAEELTADFRYDFCVARAVGPLWKLCSWFENDWLNIGHLLAVKGPRYVEEIREADSKKLLNHVNVKPVAKYLMPNTQIESVILDIYPKS